MLWRIIKAENAFLLLPEFTTRLSLLTLGIKLEDLNKNPFKITQQIIAVPALQVCDERNTRT
jgi:hypothetical protein